MQTRAQAEVKGGGLCGASPGVSAEGSLARGPPRTPLQAGDWAKPRSPGLQAESARWRRCLHTGALPGPAKEQKAAGTLVTRSCAWFASSQRPGRDIFHFFSLGDSSREGGGSKEKEKKEEVKL